MIHVRLDKGKFLQIFIISLVTLHDFPPPGFPPSVKLYPCDLCIGGEGMLGVTLGIGTPKLSGADRSAQTH